MNDFVKTSHFEEFKFFSIINVVSVILMGVMCFFRGCAENFLAISVVMALFGEFVLAATAYLRSNMKLAFSVVILNNIGLSLQTIIGSEEPGHFTMLMILSMVVMAAVVCALTAVDGKIDKIPPKLEKAIIFGLIGIIPVVTLFLRFFTNGSSGTYAWLSLGTFSVQVTEFYKFACILFYAVLFNSQSNKKTLWATVFALEMVASFVLLNEIGTLIVVLLIIFIMSFVYYDSKSGKITMWAAIAGSGLLSFALCFISNKINESRINKGLEGITFFTKFSNIYLKIANRFSNWTDPGDVATDTNYQVRQARISIFDGGLFGTTNEIKLPVEESDYVFTSIISHFGFVIALFVVAMFAIIYIQGRNVAQESKSRLRSSLSYAITVALVIAFMIPALGNINFMPLTGLAAPFIANSGSSTIINIVFIAWLLFDSKQYSIPLDAVKSKDKSKDSESEEKKEVEEEILTR